MEKKIEEIIEEQQMKEEVIESEEKEIQSIDNQRMIEEFPNIATEENNEEILGQKGEENSLDSLQMEDENLTQEEENTEEEEDEDIEEDDDGFEDLFDNDDPEPELHGQDEIELRMALYRILMERVRRDARQIRPNWRFGALGENFQALTNENIQAIMDQEHIVKIECEPLHNHPIFPINNGKELVYFSCEKVENQPAEEEDQVENNLEEDEIEFDENENVNYFCVIINTKTGVIISKRQIEFENNEIREDFLYLQNSRARSAISNDKERVIFYLFQSLLEYNIKENKLTYHNAKDVELGGEVFHIEADCMNQDYNNYLIIELYNEFTPSGDLVFYKYTLKTKHYYKLFHIRHMVAQQFTHSYCKIDRNALHGNEDCMFVFKYCRGRYHGSVEVYLFYVNLVTKRSLFKTKFSVNDEEAYYRSAIYQSFLLNDNQKFVMRIGPRSILVFHKYNRKCEIFRTKDEGEFKKFIGIFDKKLRSVLEKNLVPKEWFSFLEFEDKILVMSNFAFSSFRTKEFPNLEDYAIITSVFDNQDNDHFFIQFPFLGVDIGKELAKVEN